MVRLAGTPWQAQQALAIYLASAPVAARNACTRGPSACADWGGVCSANASASECSVGCLRIPGCTLSADSNARVQPDHPHGYEATGTPGR